MEIFSLHSSVFLVLYALFFGFMNEKKILLVEDNATKLNH